MSDTEMTAKILNLREDESWSSRASKICTFIGTELGLSLDHTETSGQYISMYYMNRCVGIKLTYNSADQSAIGSISTYAVYKLNGTTYKETGGGGINCPGYGSNKTRKADECQFYSVKFNIGELNATGFMFKDVLYFITMPFTATDYISGEVLNGIICNGKFYANSSDGSKGNVLTPLSTICNVNGLDLPVGRLLTVADPLILTSTDFNFYGYMNNNQTMLYNIKNIKGTKVGDQIQLNGSAFTCLYGNYFVR